MNSYHKYLKYKNKYLALKQKIYNQYGGAPIKIDMTNSRIIQIKTNEELENYKDKLIELTKVPCSANLKTPRGLKILAITLAKSA
jgi:hypothetical protein